MTQETEAKFFVQNLDTIKTRLHTLEAHLIHERVLETNLRFDLPNGLLRSEGRVLRLRQDSQAHLTYKGKGIKQDGIVTRTEIEFGVDDFAKAKLLLEALGYKTLLVYEKYRTTYEWRDTHIMLDKLPYGNFVEIEGEQAETIRTVASELGLIWEDAIEASYSALFERAKAALNLSFRDLTFANFEGIVVSPADLQV